MYCTYLYICVFIFEGLLGHPMLVAVQHVRAHCPDFPRCLCTHVFVCAGVYIYIHIYIRVYIYFIYCTYLYVYVSLFEELLGHLVLVAAQIGRVHCCRCVCMYVFCMCVCAYTYIYVYMYTYICFFMYLHMHVSFFEELLGCLMLVAPYLCAYSRAFSRIRSRVFGRMRANCTARIRHTRTHS